MQFERHYITAGFILILAVRESSVKRVSTVIQKSMAAATSPQLMAAKESRT